MSKERELLIRAVEWMHELKYAWVEERDWGDRDLLDLVADINKIEELLNNPEPTSALPKREPLSPLSDEKLKTIAVEDEFLLYCNEDEFIEIAREIEKAHGIGGGE